MAKFGSTSTSDTQWGNWTIKKIDGAFRIVQLDRDYNQTDKYVFNRSGLLRGLGVKKLEHEEYGTTYMGRIILHIPAEHNDRIDRYDGIEFAIGKATSSIINGLLWGQEQFDSLYDTNPELFCYVKSVDDRAYARTSIKFHHEGKELMGWAIPFDDDRVPPIIKTYEKGDEFKKATKSPGPDWELVKMDSRAFERFWAEQLASLAMTLPNNKGRIEGLEGYELPKATPASELSGPPQTVEGDSFPTADDEPPEVDNPLL